MVTFDYKIIVWVRLHYKPSGLKCEMTVTPFEWVLGRDIDGPLPLWSSNVSTLYLRDNLFSGPIPQNIGEAMPIQTDLDISWNSLNGSTPLSMGNLQALMTLVISNNHLSGEIP